MPRGSHRTPHPRRHQFIVGDHDHQMDRLQGVTPAPETLLAGVKRSRASIRRPDDRRFDELTPAEIEDFRQQNRLPRILNQPPAPVADQPPGGAAFSRAKAIAADPLLRQPGVLRLPRRGSPHLALLVRRAPPLSFMRRQARSATSPAPAATIAAAKGGTALWPGPSKNGDPILPYSNVEH